jgi:hypothetical protein
LELQVSSGRTTQMTITTFRNNWVVGCMYAKKAFVALLNSLKKHGELLLFPIIF